jgi:cytochrome P450
MSTAIATPQSQTYTPGVLDLITQMRRKGQLDFFLDVWKEYGDLAHIQIRSRNMFLVTHPDHVRYVNVSNSQNYDKLQSYDVVRELLLGDGLVSSRGELWRRQRKLMAPFFTPRSIEHYLPVMVRDGQALLARWEQLATLGEPLEISDEMMLVTAAIILHTMFSTESNAEMLKIKDAVETMIQFVAGGQLNPLRPPLWLPTPGNRKYFRARELVHSYINALLTQRRALSEAEWPDDLLTKLMRARDEQTGEAMSDSLLRDESITIFFAGHETTARTLTFLFYALATHPEVEARLYEEVNTVLADRIPTVADLKQLPYTLQVIKETLRLYPAAPLYARDAVAADVIDGTPIASGSLMMPFPYATHRHPDFWPNPERFDPDRWSPEAEAGRHPYAFHPFAAGQRICLGNNFSLFETQTLVAMLVSRFRVRLLPGHIPQIDMAGTILSKNGMPMIIERRNS